MGRIHNRRFLFLQLNATNEIVTADAAADSSSAGIFDVTPYTDSDSPPPILKQLHAIVAHETMSDFIQPNMVLFL